MNLPKVEHIFGGLIVIFFVLIIINNNNDSRSSLPAGSYSQSNSNTSEIEIKYTKKSLNVREKPNAESKVVKTLMSNEKVRTKGIEENGFTQILNSENQIYGWCSTVYLQDKLLTNVELEKAKSNNKGNIENKIRSYSSSNNKYLVKNEPTFAATSDASFDLMMNCVDSRDIKALQVMVINDQLILLHKNDVVFLVKPTFSYYIVRQEGSTKLLYVIGELLQKQ